MKIEIFLITLESKNTDLYKCLTNISFFFFYTYSLPLVHISHKPMCKPLSMNEEPIIDQIAVQAFNPELRC